MVGTKECDLVGILMGENELFSFGIRLSLFWTLGNSKHYAKIDHMQKLEPIPKCDMAGMVSIWPILYSLYNIDVLSGDRPMLFGVIMITGRMNSKEELG